MTLIFKLKLTREKFLGDLREKKILVLAILFEYLQKFTLL